MAVRFVSDVMSAERFKQEAALIVLDRLMESVAAKVLASFKSGAPSTLATALDRFEEHKVKVMARIAESAADALVGAMGPIQIPESTT